VIIRINANNPCDERKAEGSPLLLHNKGYMGAMVAVSLADI